jgi:hypothetical protein
VSKSADPSKGKYALIGLFDKEFDYETEKVPLGLPANHRGYPPPMPQRPLSNPILKDRFLGVLRFESENDALSSPSAIAFRAVALMCWVQELH